MQDQGKDFLGCGWKFPVEADRATGRILMSAGEESIRESIYIILMTRPGERMMRPDFGCHIYDFLFQRPDYPIRVRMENAVREALIRWEPRIRDIQVHAEAGEKGAQVVLQVDYVVRATNNPYNLVFPFYMNEGFGDK